MPMTRPTSLLLIVCATSGVTCANEAEDPELLYEMTIEPPKPILDGYTADPHVVMYDGTYYVYPTSDKGEWQTTDFSVWSSKDLVHWKNEGMILDVTRELKWANLRAWAPAAIRRDGKYYLYFGAELKIGVAVSDSPAGHFIDPRGRPLVSPDDRHPGQAIDPFVFIDDDQQAYLYYGQGNLYAYKLKADMITLDGPAVRMTPPGFNEGVFMFKRNGLYYFMWSENDARDTRYQVAYGISRSPLGPITIPDDNVILRKRGRVVGTGHHAVIQVPGTDRWYIFYHRHAIPNGSGYVRETCIADMGFEPDGRISKVDPLAPLLEPTAAAISSAESPPSDEVPSSPAPLPTADPR
jgi:beta-xylosidase